MQAHLFQQTHPNRKPPSTNSPTPTNISTPPIYLINTLNPPTHLVHPLLNPPTHPTHPLIQPTHSSNPPTHPTHPPNNQPTHPLTNQPTQAREWCQTNTMPYFETSSKEMLNVDQAFIAAANLALEAQMKETTSQNITPNTSINLSNKTTPQKNSSICC